MNFLCIFLYEINHLYVSFIMLWFLLNFEVFNNVCYLKDKMASRSRRMGHHSERLIEKEDSIEGISNPSLVCHLNVQLILGINIRLKLFFSIFLF